MTIFWPFGFSQRSWRLADSQPAALGRSPNDGGRPTRVTWPEARSSFRRSAKKFYPLLYWAVIVASTTAGTTMADFATRSLGVGYTGGSLILLVCVMAVLAAWYWSQGSISVSTVTTPKVEAFYWAAITFSQTLGTALGDWAADTGGLGYEGGALLFGTALAVIAGLYFWTSISRVTLFWAAFILTRPLGATLGDFLDKPLDHGGLAWSRPVASLVIAAAMVLCILVFPQRPGGLPGEAPQ